VAGLLRSFPGVAATTFLRDLGVRYVVVNRWEIGDWAAQGPQLAAAPGLRLLGTYEDGRHLLYEVLPAQPALPAPVAVMTAGPRGPRLTAQLAGALWLDSPTRLYSGARDLPLTLAMPSGKTMATTLTLPPVLLPGVYSWDLPHAAAGAVALELGGQHVAISAPPTARHGARPRLVAGDLPARLAPGDRLPCLAFGQIPDRPGLVLAAALVDGSWDVAAKDDHLLDTLTRTPADTFTVVPCGLDLPADMPAGDYFLALGLYDPATSAFLPVEGRDGAWSDGLLRIAGPVVVAGA
ncbi:MAG: hypothetical protein HGA45_32305, partial [Chloroflexales bacterium]|nr:hypothetical protein [Chloroflexales bacterium]